MLIHALGCLGAALSMSLSLPQVYKSCVQRRTNGLSPTATALGVAMPLGWITYGLLSGERIQVVTNMVAGTAGLAILTALLLTQPAVRSGRSLKVSAGSAGAVLTVVLTAIAAAALPGLTGHTVAPLLGMVLASVSLLSAIPQPLSLLRDRHQDLSGLSPLRWRMALASGLSWFCYGMATGQTAVWMSASVGITASAIVCTVLHLRRERKPVDLELYAGIRCWRDSVTTRSLAMAGV